MSTGAAPPPSWRDHRDRAGDAPAPPGPGDPPASLPIGEFQGATYRRNAFAAATDVEASALRALTGVVRGSRVLDVGCADARHLRALARDPGVVGVGVDVSPALVAAGRDAALADGVEVRLLVGDARELPAVLGDEHGSFDAAWSCHQGALGTSPESDPSVLAGMAGAVRPGGIVAVTLFHALFAARHLVEGDHFDPVHLVHHQVSEVRGPDDARRRFDLWTASYTVRDAARLVADAGLALVSVRGAEPGAYDRRRPGEVGLDDPELLVVARRPPGRRGT